jgi:hypothetical protein
VFDKKVTDENTIIIRLSEDIHHLLKQKERRLVAPVAGLPGVRLIGQTVLACLQDHRLHVQAI